MIPNSLFKDLRKSKKLTQSDFANELGVSQGTITDIERGRIGVSKKIKQKILEKYGIEAGYFETVKQLNNTEIKQGVEIGGKQGKPASHSGNYSYMYKFKDFLDKNYPEYNELGRDIINILSIGEVTTVLHDTKIGDPIFFGVDNLKTVKSFKEFKDIGIQAYTEAMPHKDILHEFGEACRKFIYDLQRIKDEIDMDFDFEDWLS